MSGTWNGANDVTDANVDVDAVADDDDVDVERSGGSRTEDE